METGRNRRRRTEGGERAEEREKSASGDQREITDLSLERRNLSSVRNAGITDVGCRVAMLRGKE